MFKFVIVGAVGLAMLSSMAAEAQTAAAPTSTPAAPVCLRRADIDTFDAPNDYTVIVRKLSGEKIKLALMGPCINLSYRMSLGIKTVGGTMALSCISPGDSIIDVDRGTRTRFTCPIRSITLYTPAIEAADKAAAAAKKAAADSGQ